MMMMCLGGEANVLRRSARAAKFCQSRVFFLYVPAAATRVCLAPRYDHVITSSISRRACVSAAVYNTSMKCTRFFLRQGARSGVRTFALAPTSTPRSSLQRMFYISNLAKMMICDWHANALNRSSRSRTTRRAQICTV